MRKAFLILLVLAGGFGAWAFLSRTADETGEAARYRTDNISRGPIIATVSATGTVLATTTVIVGSQLSGQVVEILADHNDEVKAGQVLARLNRDTLLARRDGSVADLQQARAARQLNDAQAEKTRADLQRVDAVLRDVQAQAERARTLFRDAEATFERQSSLKERGIATDVALQNATTQRDALRSAALSAEAQVASARAQIAALEADLKVVEAQKASSEAQIAKAEAVVRQIEVDLANSEIRSSVDGVVVQRNVELGQTVAASLQAPTLFLVAQNLKTIEVNINLDETDVGRVKPGQTVEFTVNAYPARTFTGTVRLVRLGSQTVQNVVIYTTIVTVKNDDLALLPGMTANARIFTERKADVLRVSNAALRWQPPGASRAASATPGEGGASASVPVDDNAGPFSPPAAGGGGPVRQATALLDSLKAELALDDRQFAEAQKLGRAMGEALQHAGSPEERREMARKERQRFSREFEAILTPEQREKYRAFREARVPRGQDAQGRAGAQRVAEAGVPGRVHVLDSQGNPKPVSLRIGATDGTWTEVLSGEIKPGDAVINGVVSAPRNRASTGFRFGF
ncbi:MAG: HlyD family secretion protein [Methylobacterium sp.]|nr:HlyD family secretion protein [Methylobacterium sp.]MCA3606984.1 HlyD family secretion protein [Methylobacterium sp.]MCA3610033.1 HlyD family secretion protein [Methylobacterium sp.]MCA3617671.1 HlyD family secretion protein [Methylobacterium sp.]MCA3620228.1 HlyD family secretion protein [Methylobacterium sp.]